MAKRNVKWTKTADRQYFEVLNYWVQRNKSATYSKKLIKKVSELTNQISIAPEMYKKVEIKNTHVAILGNYSLYYKIVEENIIVTAFWDNRRGPAKLLEYLKS
ncbi:MAG: hypothetical protein Kapaf2KO_02900 [Candidatus Kapaibacteriales bacterium]